MFNGLRLTLDGDGVSSPVPPSPTGPSPRSGRRSAVVVGMDAKMQDMLAAGAQPEPAPVPDIPEETRALVMQAIFISCGPTKKGQAMQDEVGAITTVRELSKWYVKNGPNLSELSSIQINTQLMALGHWDRGLKKLKAAMKLVRCAVHPGGTPASVANPIAVC